MNSSSKISINSEIVNNVNNQNVEVEVLDLDGIISESPIVWGDSTITPEELLAYTRNHDNASNIKIGSYRTIVTNFGKVNGYSFDSYRLYGGDSLGFNDRKVFERLILDGYGVVARSVENNVPGGIVTTGPHNVSIIYAGKNENGQDMCYVIDSNNSVDKHGGYISCMTINQALNSISAFVDLGMCYASVPTQTA